MFLAAVVEQAIKKRKTLTDEQKYAAYVALHAVCMSRGGKFKRNDKKDLAQFFKVGVRSIQRVWQKAMEQIAEGLEVDVSNQKKRRCPLSDHSLGNWDVALPHCTES